MGSVRGGGYILFSMIWIGAACFGDADARPTLTIPPVAPRDISPLFTHGSDSPCAGRSWLSRSAETLQMLAGCSSDARAQAAVE